MRYKLLLAILVILSLIASACSTNSKAEVTGQTDKEPLTEQADVSREIGYTEVFARGMRSLSGIVIDSKGNMYANNRTTKTMYKISQEGEVEKYLTLPCERALCMAVDSQDNLYVAGRNVLLKISPDQEISTIAEGFTCCDAVALDNTENIYVTDSFADKVYFIDKDTYEKKLLIENTEGKSVTGLWNVTGIAFDKNYEYLYLIRMYEGKVVRYPIKDSNIAGGQELIAEGIYEPDHLVIVDDEIYVTGFGNNEIYRIKGNEMKVIASGSGKFSNPSGLTLGRTPFDEDCLYIVNNSTGNIVKVYIGKS